MRLRLEYMGVLCRTISFVSIIEDFFVCICVRYIVSALCSAVLQLEQLTNFFIESIDMINLAILLVRCNKNGLYYTERHYKRGHKYVKTMKYNPNMFYQVRK